MKLVTELSYIPRFYGNANLSGEEFTLINNPIQLASNNRLQSVSPQDKQASLH